MTNEECLPYFNPVTENDYLNTIDNWTDALLDITH
jgi:hypothetical protein